MTRRIKKIFLHPYVTF